MVGYQACESDWRLLPTVAPGANWNSKRLGAHICQSSCIHQLDEAIVDHYPRLLSSFYHCLSILDTPSRYGMRVW